MARLFVGGKGKTLFTQNQNRIEACSRSWMTNYGLRRKFFHRDFCLVCSDEIIKRYVKHPFALPPPYPQGQWLTNDCTCIKKERSSERLARTKILISEEQTHPLPPALRQHSFSSFRVTELNRKAYDTCYSFTKNFARIKDGRGLLLLGRSGTGKTHLASAIANNLWQREHTVKFVYMPALLERFRNVDELIQSLLAADILILDDICSEWETGRTSERLLTIVDGRLTALKPTIFTSNFPAEDFEKRLGMRVASRILGHNFQVVLKGPDHRLLQNKAFREFY